MSLENTTDIEAKKLKLLKIDVKTHNKNVQFYVRHLLKGNFSEVHNESIEEGHPIRDLDKAANIVYAIGDEELSGNIRHFWSYTPRGYIGTRESA